MKLFPLSFLRKCQKVSEFDLKQIEQLKKLQKEVIEFVPCEVMLTVSEDRPGIYYLEHYYLVLDQQKQITIEYNSYQKKYIVHCYNTFFPYLDGNGVYRVTEVLQKPVNMRKLSKSKIIAWITYYKDYYRLAAAANEECKNKIDNFKATLKDLPVKWWEHYDKDEHNRGRIEKGGLIYEFEIHANGYIKETVRVDYKNENLSAFLALSDNKFISKT